MLMSAPIATRVWAIAGESPVVMISAPMRWGGVDSAGEVVGDRFVDVGYSGDVEDDDLGAVGAYCAQELLGQLVGSCVVKEADDGQDEQPFPDLHDRGGQFADRVLLLADDAFSLFDEADRDGVCDAVGGGLIGVEHFVQQVELVAVFLEQRPGEDVAVQEDDAYDLVGFHAAGDDSFGEVAGVVP